ncbi:AlpA family transcriptional regulator [Shewanella benthica]|nr:AlpA family transcriptional regulator [Shewanella benthica]
MNLLRLKDVIKCTGLARSTIYKFMDQGAFPKPAPLGARAVAWVEDEVQEWVFARIEERDLENDTLS